MASYVFGLNYGPDGVELDWMIDVSAMVGCKDLDEFKKMLAVRKRIDPDDTEADKLQALPQHLAFFTDIRSRFTDNGFSYKVDYEDGELTRDELEAYLQSLNKKELREFLERARI
jgi:hypothetical protein